MTVFACSKGPARGRRAPTLQPAPLPVQVVEEGVANRAMATAEVPRELLARVATAELDVVSGESLHPVTAAVVGRGRHWKEGGSEVILW